MNLNRKIAPSACVSVDSSSSSAAPSSPRVFTYCSPFCRHKYRSCENRRRRSGWTSNQQQQDEHQCRQTEFMSFLEKFNFARPEWRGRRRRSSRTTDIDEKIKSWVDVLFVMLFGNMKCVSWIVPNSSTTNIIIEFTESSKDIQELSSWDGGGGRGAEKLLLSIDRI